jgi:two-component system CheB/CheR fusion protein
MIRLSRGDGPPAGELVECSPRGSNRERGSRVLVVEDDLDQAVGLADVLELLGYEVWTVRDGPSALAAARASCPEVILLDIGLPGQDGYQVAAQLRKERCGECALMIAVTGHGTDEDAWRSREAGFDHHLVKPIDIRLMVTVLAEAPV